MNKAIRKIIPLLLVLVLLAGFMPQKAEAAVRLNRSTATVGIKQTITLRVTGAKTKVKWKSSNKKVATVNSKGVVKGKKKGTVTITAKVKKKKYKCKVTVVQPVTGVRLNKARASLKTGNTLRLRATISPWNAGVKRVTWRSSNTRVATVTSKGLVRTVGKGSTVITATANDGSGKRAACTVTVAQPVTGVRLNRTSAALKVGNTMSLGAAVNPANANNKRVTWRSSNARVATVTSKGLVRAVGKGSAVITATANDGSGKRAACTVTVAQPVTGVSMNHAAVTLKNGNTMFLSASVSPASANNKGLTWKSSDTRVAIVNSAGLVRAVGKGKAVITAAVNDGSGKKASCSVTVVQPVTGVVLNKTSASMETGETLSLGVTVSPSNADNRNVTWKSDNTDVATVNTDGSVRAVGAGTATITAATNDGSGKSSTCNITVTAPAPVKPEDPIPTEVTGETEDPVDPENTIQTDSAGANESDNPAETGDKEIIEDGDDVEIVNTELVSGEEDGSSNIHEVAELTHTHTWVNVTQTVHHDEKSHTEEKQVGTKTVVDKEAWDEAEDVYETVATCSKCGYSSTDAGDVAEHTVDAHDGDASYSTEIIKTTIHHDAVTHEEPIYEKVKVVDEEAWDETVVVGQRCSKCGAIR